MASEPSAEVLVGDPAPFPETFGVPFSPPSTLIDDRDELCGFGAPYVARDVFIDLDESALPWLALARVNLEINGTHRSTDYGRLARGFDGGSRALVEQLRRVCHKPGFGMPENTLQTWLVRLELELPGVQERPPPVELTVDMDCRQSCASVGMSPWLLGALLLAARRATSQSRRVAS